METPGKLEKSSLPFSLISLKELCYVEKKPNSQLRLVAQTQSESL
jgi:hypothetical protein